VATPAEANELLEQASPSSSLVCVPESAALIPANPRPSGDGAGSTPAPAAPPASADLPVLAAFERRLKAVTRWTPVTLVIVALNIGMFAWMALRHARVLEFHPSILMSWGADYAPRTFNGEWWRTITSMFVHSGLGHLAANLCFLLLIAALVERLLGPVRFALVYLFAGLGGELLGLGWFPSSVAVGSSAALYGVYGAFLGCYLRGVRTIPWQLFGRQVGLLILYTCLTILLDYLDLERTLIPHLGGMLFGFAGGLLFGHVLTPRPAWRRCLAVGLATAVCASFLGLTAWGVQRSAGKAVRLLARYDRARERERILMGRFMDGLRRWEKSDLGDADLCRLLRDQLIPEWERARGDCSLQLPQEFADLERQRLSIRELYARDPSRGRPKQREEKRDLSDKEYDQLYRLYFKLRLDNWRALADGLQPGGSPPPDALTDLLWVEMLRKELDELVDEDNPLWKAIEFSRDRIREKKQAAPGGGLK
jgi:membrane associated rhomboid family serine protease